MEHDVLILAGGFGTRLRDVVKDIPKPMAPIKNKPFLEYIFRFLEKNGAKRVVLSVGYKKDYIINHFGDRYKDIEITYAVEDSPLGTGGAVLNALEFIKSDTFFIVNGDTYFDVDFESMWDFFKRKNADLLIALKKLSNTQRYGSVLVDKDFRIVDFVEKGSTQEGYINGGIYLLDKALFSKLSLQSIFSFEKDFLEKYYKDFRFYGLPFDSYFIDIGVPEDYERAKSEIV